MFKTIGKILVILLVAALVSYALYGLVQNGSLSNATFGNENEFSRINNNNQSSVNTVSQNRSNDLGERDRGASAFGMIGALGTAMQIGIIAVIVLGIQKGTKTLVQSRRTVSNYA